MNQMAREYHDNSRPAYCAKYGLVDEIVSLTRMRNYLCAFAGAAYQNPKSICPQHQMILPRIIRDYKNMK
jgi:glutaconyl-CoA decarboxylase